MKKGMLEELAQVINTYIAGHKSRNLRSLSVRSGVAYATLRRIVQKETVPNMETVLSIMQYITNKEDGIHFLKKHYPGFGAFLEKFYVDNQEFPSESLNQLIKDRENFAIITMASTDEGTTREAIKELLGTFGENKLEILLETDILKEINGKVKTVLEDFGFIDADTILEQIKNGVDLFSKKKLGNYGVLAGLQSEGLSELGLKRIHQVIKKAEMDVANLKKDPENRGNHAAYIAFLMNTL